MSRENVYRRQWQAHLNTELSDDRAAACGQRIAGRIARGDVLGVCAYRWLDHIFVYCEGLGEPPDPGELFEPLLAALCEWPGGHYFVEMMDVFHFNEPQSPEHWRRRAPVPERVGKVGRLRPEMVSRYIYYHYVLQEERTFGGDKYEIIALHENLLFGYFELPAVMEEPLHPPRLHTKSMPANWEEARIPDCFVRWNDYAGCLRPMERWLSVWSEEL